VGKEVCERLGFRCNFLRVYGVFIGISKLGMIGLPELWRKNCVAWIDGVSFKCGKKWARKGFCLGGKCRLG
jgi:hypothetical protein